ncbi:MAG: HAD family phosphatase [Candidatus Shapirobacteria bacterium]
MTNPEAVIFDLNGVFLQSRPLSTRVSEKFRVDPDQLFSKLKTILKEVRTPGEKPDEIWNPILQMLNITRNEFFSFWFSGETLNPDLLDFARELQTQGIKIFILSNNFAHRTEYYRRHYPEMFTLFNGVYFSWETGFVKPDIRAYQKLLSDHQLLPANCVYFDDSPENISVAGSLGIRSHLYTGLPNARQIMVLECKEGA